MKQRIRELDRKIRETKTDEQLAQIMLDGTGDAAEAIIKMMSGNCSATAAVITGAAMLVVKVVSQTDPELYNIAKELEEGTKAIAISWITPVNVTNEFIRSAEEPDKK